jgi:hypothetical protein
VVSLHDMLIAGHRICSLLNIASITHIVVLQVV